MFYNPLWSNIFNNLPEPEKIINKTDEYLQTAYALPKKKPGWATSNDIILEEKTLHLRRFLNPNICARRPVLILPPQAGHHGNIADYSPEQSLVRVFHQYGYDVYVTDWQSATPEYKDLGLEDYINLTDRAVEEIRKRTGIYKIHVVGECQGGWQAAVYTALFPEKVSALVVAASPIDLTAAHSEMVDYARLPLRFFEALVDSNHGLMNGEYLLTGFKNMQFSEHYWHKYKRLWDMVWTDDQEGLARHKRFEDWYEQTQMLPGRFYLDIIDKVFKQNGLVNPGTLKINGCSVDLRDITCPLILMAGLKDHITPAEQVFAMKKHVSTDADHVVEIISEGGHIGTLMGNESLRKNWTKVNEMLNQVV